MANALHTFLSSCFTQAVPIIGETFTLGAQTDLVGIFSAVDGTLQMDVSGYEVQADYFFVADKAQFAARPTEGSTVTYGGSTYQIVGIAEDLSAYRIALKLLSATP